MRRRVVLVRMEPIDVEGAQLSSPKSGTEVVLTLIKGSSHCGEAYGRDAVSAEFIEIPSATAHEGGTVAGPEVPTQPDGPGDAGALA